MSVAIGLTLLALGIVVWLLDDRLWLLGAGAGALLVSGLASLLQLDGMVALIAIIGLALLLGIFGFMGKTFVGLLILIIGCVAGSGVTIGLLDILGLDSGLLVWALVGSLIGVGLFARSLTWASIIFAALVGSLLIVRGTIVGFMPNLAGVTGGLLVVGLAVAGIFYHARQNAARQ